MSVKIVKVAVKIVKVAVKIVKVAVKIVKVAVKIPVAKQNGDIYLTSLQIRKRSVLDHLVKQIVFQIGIF